MPRRSILLALLALIGLSAFHPARALGDVPVHVRVIKGSRQGPAHIDPRLENLRRQLSHLAYVKWDQTDEQKVTLSRGKTEFVRLPDGEHVGLTLQEERGTTVTFEVALASRNTQSRLTVEKGQRIVHQVTGEKGGSAFFLTVLAWP
ncbi:MAG TPA: hypothetical protein VML50_06340 [Anaeromyxobacter sp.]|nr:hypothetical protein [Anaeromyxobacter sp.]